MSEMSGRQLAAMIGQIAAAIADKRDDLNALDSALGDGDHGTGISTAFAEAARLVNDLETPTPPAVLQTTSQALMNRMGGASGALFGMVIFAGQYQRQRKNCLEPGRYGGNVDGWPGGCDGPRTCPNG